MLNDGQNHKNGYFNACQPPLPSFGSARATTQRHVPGAWIDEMDSR
jgi:hypothetical protein